MTRTSIAVTALVLSTLLVGCTVMSSPPAQAPTPTPLPSAVGDGETAVLADGTTALVGLDTAGSTSATQVRGRFTTFSRGCALLDDGSGSLRLLILEHGTTATPDGSGFVSPDGVIVRDGDGISAAGDLSTVEAIGARQAWPTVPRECFGVGQIARVTADLRLDDSVVAEQLAAFGHREEYADGTLLLVPEQRPTSGADARTVGVLTRLEGGCLGLTNPGGHRHLVKWPYGSSWEPKQQVLTLPEQGQVRLGDEVVLGGGQGLAAWLAPALPAGCVYDDFWAAT